MDQNIPDQFFDKLKAGKHTAKDHEQFVEWLKTAPLKDAEIVLAKYAAYYENKENEPLDEDHKLVKLIESKINEAENRPYSDDRHRVKIWPVLKRSVAAIVLLGSAFFIYHQLKPKPKTQDNTPHYVKVKPIVPGGNKATLTLANGKVIILDSAKNGQLASQGNVNIKKIDGRLLYQSSGNAIADNGQIQTNTISTPRGGQYQVVLPDGSQVWLDAASSLSYPTRFTGSDRKVVLTGEAYFEVAKDKAHPFKVNVNNMEVQVLGTHFNIMAYSDEPAAKTTLLEGSVKVTQGQNSRMIIPGEQAVVAKTINVIKVNAAEAVEWKNGNFNFSHEKLESIMRKIARWYDIDLAYNGKTTNATFVGTIPRSHNIGEVLKYLELTGLVHFKIIERRVTVMP